MKVIILLGLAIGGVALGYFAVREQGSPFALADWRPIDAPANADPSAPTRDHITSLGRLEPASEVIDVSGPPGLRIHELDAVEGAPVQKGDILALLEDYPRRLAGRKSAAARLQEAQSMRAAETQHGEAETRQAELELRQIETLTPLEIQTEEAKIRRLEADLDNSRRSLDRLAALHAKNRVTDQEVDDQTLIVLRTTEELAGARLVLARLEAAREIDLLKVRQRLESARASLHRAQVSTHALSLAAELELAEAELESTVVRAPIAGTILKVLTHPGERIADEAILKMGDTEHMYVIAEVYETDARFVKAGQRARIESPTLAQPLEGSVERVSRLIFKNNVLDIDPAARVDARVIEVRIRLDDSAAASQFNHLQVRVRIDLDSAAAQDASQGT